MLDWGSSGGAPAELVAENDALQARLRDQEGELAQLRARVRALEAGDDLLVITETAGDRGGCQRRHLSTETADDGDGCQ